MISKHDNRIVCLSSWIIQPKRELRGNCWHCQCTVCKAFHLRSIVTRTGYCRSFASGHAAGLKNSLHETAETIFPQSTSFRRFLSQKRWSLHTLIKGNKKWRPRRHSPKQPRKQGISERKERRHRRVERREGKKGVDWVVEEDQQVLGNWKHKSVEEGR